MYSFPAELSEAGRLNAATVIAQHLVDTHGIAADFSIHKPGKEGDERNFHCHMLTTTRRLTESGLGVKAREWTDLKSGAILAKQFRAFVAATLTAELVAEGKADLVTVEYLSFKERGGGKAPTKHQGVAKTNAARKEKGKARAAWQTKEWSGQQQRQVAERKGLEGRQEAALAAKDRDLAEREQKGAEAIQAAQKRPTGLSKIFQTKTTNAPEKLAALKADIQQERQGFVARQKLERDELAARHHQENKQFKKAASAKAQFDRVSEVQGRKGPEQTIERGRDPKR